MVKTNILSATGGVEDCPYLVVVFIVEKPEYYPQHQPFAFIYAETKEELHAELDRFRTNPNIPENSFLNFVFFFNGFSLGRSEQFLSLPPKKYNQ